MLITQLGYANALTRQGSQECTLQLFQQQGYNIQGSYRSPRLWVQGQRDVNCTTSYWGNNTYDHGYSGDGGVQGHDLKDHFWDMRDQSIRGVTTMCVYVAVEQPGYTMNATDHQLHVHGRLDSYDCKRCDSLGEPRRNKWDDLGSGSDQWGEFIFEYVFRKWDGLKQLCTGIDNWVTDANDFIQRFRGILCLFALLICFSVGVLASVLYATITGFHKVIMQWVGGLYWAYCKSAATMHMCTSWYSRWNAKRASAKRQWAKSWKKMPRYQKVHFIYTGGVKWTNQLLLLLMMANGIIDTANVVSIEVARPKMRVGTTQFNPGSVCNNFEWLEEGTIKMYIQQQQQQQQQMERGPVQRWNETPAHRHEPPDKTQGTPPTKSKHPPFNCTEPEANTATPNNYSTNDGGNGECNDKSK